MSDIKRPMSHMGGPEEDFAGQNSGMTVPQPTTSKGLTGKILVVVLVIIVILGGLYAVSKYTPWNILNVPKAGSVSVKGWQAVFLTNGQVYFGRIVKQSGDSIELKEIYYLQVTRQLQPTPNGQTAEQQAAEQQQLSLVKLGDELHGPTDYMVINRGQVLFIEELKEDSKVVDAIKRYSEEQANKK